MIFHLYVTQNQFVISINLFNHFLGPYSGIIIIIFLQVKKERPIIADSKSNPSPESKSNPSPESSTKRGKTKNKQKLSADSCSEISSSSVTLGSNAGLPHLSDKLIGQHGGELLFNYHQSNRCNLIIGMVVQQTQVNFSMLSICPSVCLSLNFLHFLTSP